MLHDRSALTNPVRDHFLRPYEVSVVIPRKLFDGERKVAGHERQRGLDTKLVSSSHFVTHLTYKYDCDDSKCHDPLALIGGSFSLICCIL